MDKAQNREFFNTQVNRYVRNHSTNILAKPNPGSEYRHIRTLAKAVIYQALVDAVKDTIANESQYRNLMKNSHFWKKHREYMYGRVKVVEFKSIYGKTFIWTSDEPESVKFFYGRDYDFYSDLAGIDIAGDRLLKMFAERKNASDCSIDSLLDG